MSVIDLTDEMVVAAMEHVPGCDHDDMVNALALEAALRIASRCPECNGSGVIVYGVTVYEHGCGFPHDDTDERPCPECSEQEEIKF
jgi:ssDNA-binding Zn-finger/Zn-ribbon topoisomerase 1